MAYGLSHFTRFQDDYEDDSPFTEAGLCELSLLSIVTTITSQDIIKDEGKKQVYLAIL